MKQNILRIIADPCEFHDHGGSVSMDTLPAWARETFEKVLRHIRPLARKRRFFKGMIRPLFT